MRVGTKAPRSPFASLALIYLRSMFGFSVPTRAELRDPKKLAKTAGVVVLAIFLVADMGFLFGMTNMNLYRALKSAGLQELLLLNAASSSAVMVLLLSFITALSTWSMSAMEAGFLSMPIPPSRLLGAKMLMIYASNALFALFMMAIAAAVYGWGERPPALFYLYALVSAVALPMLPVAVSYIALVPLMSAAKVLRSRTALLYAGGILGLAAALGFNMYLQRAVASVTEPAWLRDHYAGPDSVISRIGSAWPPSWLAWKAMAGSRNAMGALYALANLALGLAAGAGTAALFGRAYGRSVAGFGETTLSRAAPTGEFMGRTFAARPAFVSLLAREIRTMNREPMYFLNGPLVPVLMPVILAVTYIVQRSEFDKLIAQMGPLAEGPIAYLACAALGAFLGSSTSIACTAVSRDAKALAWLRSLPVDPLELMGAKYAHAELFAVFGAAVGALAGGLALGLTALDMALAFALALVAASAFNLAGLWMDTAWPRLRWDNPIVALKQNPNAVFQILGAMAILGGCGVLAGKLELPRYGYAALFGGLFAAAIAVLGAAYPAFARRRIRRWEA